MQKRLSIINSVDQSSATEVGRAHSTFKRRETGETNIVSHLRQQEGRRLADGHRGMRLDEPAKTNRRPRRVESESQRVEDSSTAKNGAAKTYKDKLEQTS